MITGGGGEIPSPPVGEGQGEGDINMNKVLVIGGGISGLTVSYWLHKTEIDVTLIEKENRPGGSIRTERDRGYLIECGPNSTLDIYKEVDDLCEGLGILGEKIYGERATRNRYVVRDGRLRPLPSGPLQFLATDLWSIRGKLRLICEPFVPKYSGTSDESIAKFVIRRTGQEFLDYAIDPFVTGVFAGDPARLSLKSCFPKMYSLEKEYGSLTKGALLSRRKREEPRRKVRLFSFREGIQTLPDAISDTLGDRFIKGSAVTSLKKVMDGFEVIVERDGEKGIFRGNSIVVATPAWAAANIIHPLSEDIASSLNQIEYIPIVLIFTGFDRKYIKGNLDGFGFLIPSKESNKSGHKGYSILGSIWSSAIFPDRAPDEKVAFTNILGGARKVDILEYSDKDLIDMTLQDLKSILRIEEKPDFVRVIRHMKAIPQYTLGHQERINSIEQWLQDIPGLYLAGNYINGISVGHCIAEATRLATRIRLKPNTQHG